MNLSTLTIVLPLARKVSTFKSTFPVRFLKVQPVFGKGSSGVKARYAIPAKDLLHSFSGVCQHRLEWDAGGEATVLGE